MVAWWGRWWGAIVDGGGEVKLDRSVDLPLVMV